jgi:hypothetical protein
VHRNVSSPDALRSDLVQIAPNKSKLHWSGSTRQ